MVDVQRVKKLMGEQGINSKNPVYALWLKKKKTDVL